MKKRISKSKLGRTKSHREALLRNQMKSLFTYGFLITTTPKAKALKQTAESFLYKAQNDDLKTKRLLYSIFEKKELIEKTSEYLSKKEGNISIVKVSYRGGDNAEKSKVSLTGYQELFGKKKTIRKTKGKKKGKQAKEEIVETRKDEGKSQKSSINKGIMGIKEKFVTKQRARSRSGI